MYCRKVTFYGGVAYQGGAIYLSGKSELELLNSEIRNNYAATYGGGVYAEGFSSFIVAESTVVQSNRGFSGLGDDFYMTNSDYTFSLSDVSISNPYASNSIYANAISLQATRLSVVGVSKGTSTQGAALQCIDCSTIVIAYSKFDSCKS